ncbi:hypothetical protein ASE63_23150 [Bosea sp. Root381]|uniref:sensor histidine kinase n=1 Tax=Bosea sp. Root381 TaxID=1736524 RepID=UPI0007136032|nr:PAS domain-containing sensor histidine kinase [Bosea sp. Root381]KRE07146.1 hypothetical protein ASE63_23150 [Bosea sp. Root381]
MKTEEDLSSSFGENVLWFISQVHFENHRLALAAEAWNRGHRTDADVRELQLRLDMAFSRLAVLSEGVYRNVIARNLGSEPLATALSHLKTFEEALGRAMVSRAPLPQSHIDSLLNDAVVFSAASNDVMTADRDDLAAQRDTYRRNLLEAITAILLIFGFGIFIVVRLVKSLRSVALAEAALRRDRDFSNLLLESSGDGVAAFDMDGRCTHLNAVMSTIFPVPGGADVVGHLIKDAYRLPDGHIILNMIRDTVAGQSLHMPAHPVPNGNRYVEKFTHPVRSGNAIVGGVLLIRDVTDAHLARMQLLEHRDQLEATVKQRTGDLEDALERETRLRELYKGFVSMVSHQFRTPLSIVDSSAQRMIRRGKEMSEEEIRERAGKIRTAILRLTRLVSSTLNAAKLDAGEIDFAPRRCDLGKLIVEACERQKEATPNRRFTMALEQLPDWVSCDPLLIDQVVANLLSNAVKYSAPPDPIEITAELDDCWIHISISDRGVGIPDDERDKLFERFFRARTSAGVEGTGIGLHVARTIARLHQGDVVSLPRVAGGSTFVLRIPREEALAA